MKYNSQAHTAVNLLSDPVDAFTASRYTNRRWFKVLPSHRSYNLHAYIIFSCPPSNASCWHAGHVPGVRPWFTTKARWMGSSGWQSFRNIRTQLSHFQPFFFFWNGDKVDLHTARTSTNVPQQSRGWILSTWTRLRKALLWGNKNGDLEAEKLRLRRISSLLSMGVCITIHNAVNRQCPRVACTQRRWTGGGGCLVFWGDVQRQ
jgi:hypothetical protein